jgi:hypothetical protein
VEGLADVYIELPISEAEDWENYFWYATGPSPDRLPMFVKSAKDKEWVDRGDALFVVRGENAHVRSPVSGQVISLYHGAYLIQPIKGFSLPENVGRFMFGEVIELGKRIEAEVATYDQMGFIGRLFNRPSFRLEDVKSRRKSPEL